jgi:hypothetical protein
MLNQATSPRLAAAAVTDSIEVAIAAAGQRGRGAPADLTPVLVRYWHELPHHSAERRRAWLHATRTRLRNGEVTTRALVPHALGDHDEDIVCTAVAEYVATHPVTIERRRALIDEAVDWIRRGLALNRGAVFAALLCIGDAGINEALGGLRLILTHAETEVVCRRVTGTPVRATREFLGDWLQLLEASESPDSIARRHVADALAVSAA